MASVLQPCARRTSHGACSALPLRLTGTPEIRVVLAAQEGKAMRAVRRGIVFMAGARRLLMTHMPHALPWRWVIQLRRGRPW